MSNPESRGKAAAPYYSRQAGGLRLVRRHPTLAAALRAAGESGHVWDTRAGRQLQSTQSLSGQWVGVSPDRGAPDFGQRLVELGELPSKAPLCAAEPAI